MKQRINAFEKRPGVLKALYGLGAYLAKSPVEKSLLNLIYFRVSQVNGCAFCLDMHSKDLRAKGETEQRLYVLDAWREAPFYTDRERAALGWAEAVTKITGGMRSAPIVLTTAKPSVRGICTSRSTKSGFCSRIRTIASLPFRASKTDSTCD